MKWEWFSLLAVTNQLFSCIKLLGNSFEIIIDTLFKITLNLFGITEKLFVMWILSLFMLSHCTSGGARKGLFGCKGVYACGQEALDCLVRKWSQAKSVTSILRMPWIAVCSIFFYKNKQTCDKNKRLLCAA